jgi:hypothetical protein
MYPSLKSKIEAAIGFTQLQLQKLDMGGKGATITAAKMQSRIETLTQVIEWSNDFVSKQIT